MKCNNPSGCRGVHDRNATKTTNPFTHQQESTVTCARSFTKRHDYLFVYARWHVANASSFCVDLTMTDLYHAYWWRSYRYLSHTADMCWAANLNIHIGYIKVKAIARTIYAARNCFALVSFDADSRHTILTDSWSSSSRRRRRPTRILAKTNVTLNRCKRTNAHIYSEPTDRKSIPPKHTRTHTHIRLHGTLGSATDAPLSVI